MMNRTHINIQQILEEKNSRESKNRISRIREIRKLGRQGEFRAFFFDIESKNDLEKEDARYDALAWYVDDMWHEACWSYVWGTFRSCVMVAACAVEGALKYKLLDTSGKIDERMTLGGCINAAKKYGVFPQHETDPVLVSARHLLTLRNDLTHANRERRYPEVAISSDGPEHETIDLGGGIQSITPYRIGAIAALKDARQVLAYLKRRIVKRTSLRR